MQDLSRFVREGLGNDLRGRPIFTKYTRVYFFLGINATNTVLAPFGIEPYLWNSFIVQTTSSLSISQYDLMKLKLKPSGPGALFPSEPQIVDLISSSKNGADKVALPGYLHRQMQHYQVKQ